MALTNSYLTSTKNLESIINSVINAKAPDRFTNKFLEDLGYLPRIAFNLDKCFKKCCTSGKQALTMCMGFGCNAAGVVGCRIIDSPRERLIAILTNNFVPCNRKISFFNNNGYNFYWNFFRKFCLIFCINYFCFVINFIRNFPYTFHF